MVHEDDFQRAAADVKGVLNVQTPNTVSSHSQEALDILRRKGASMVSAMALQLPLPIRSVLGISAKKEMSRIYATPIVSTGAVVANMLSLRDGAVRKLPRDARGSHRNVTMAKTPVPAAVQGSGPKPALIRTGDGNLRPESFLKRQRPQLDVTLLTDLGPTYLGISAIGAGGILSGHVDLLTSRAMPGTVQAVARPLYACPNSTKNLTNTPIFDSAAIAAADADLPDVQHPGAGTVLLEKGR